MKRKSRVTLTAGAITAGLVMLLALGGPQFLAEGLAGRNETEKGFDMRQGVTESQENSGVARGRRAVAWFAGGCFWGVEYYLEKAPGVLDVVSGYMGGTLPDPSYERVKKGDTGHAETVQVTFDPAVVGYEELARLFFEIHDPTQVDRQGPDVGHQYRSVVFYADEEQREIAERLIGLLRQKGYDVATRVEPAGTFYAAEDYHQDYYDRTGKLPYCHARVKRF